jgi:hypothetical protein
MPTICIDPTSTRATFPSHNLVIFIKKTVSSLINYWMSLPWLYMTIHTISFLSFLSLLLSLSRLCEPKPHVSPHSVTLTITQKRQREKGKRKRVGSIRKVLIVYRADPTELAPNTYVQRRLELTSYQPSTILTLSSFNISLRYGLHTNRSRDDQRNWTTSRGAYS